MVNSTKSIYEVIIYEFLHQQDRGRLTTLLFITKLKIFDKWGASVKECFSSLLQINKGYEFESETDTEVIPKLIKYIYDNRESDSVSFSTLVERVIQQLVSHTEPYFKQWQLSCRKNVPTQFIVKRSVPLIFLF